MINLKSPEEIKRMRAAALIAAAAMDKVIAAALQRLEEDPMIF